MSCDHNGGNERPDVWGKSHAVLFHNRHNHVLNAILGALHEPVKGLLCFALFLAELRVQRVHVQLLKERVELIEQVGHVVEDNAYLLCINRKDVWGWSKVHGGLVE